MGHEEEVVINGVKIWNFSHKAEEYIPDDLLRNKVKRLLNMNVRGSRPLEGVGVATIGDCDFRDYSFREIQKINEAKLILFLSRVSSDIALERGPNTGHFMSTSENSGFVIQNFLIENDYVTEVSGFIVSIHAGGYLASERKVEIPSYVLSPSPIRFDKRLMFALGVMKRKNPTLYRRVISAADLLFESYFNDPQLSINARVLLMCASFEVLLNLPDSNQRKAFKDHVERLTKVTGDRKGKYRSERRNANGYVVESGTVKAKWADSFYTLRNHIIHGQKVSRRDFIFNRAERHTDIVPKFFTILLKQLINEDAGEKVFFDEIKWQLSSNSFGESYRNFIYEPNHFRYLVPRTQA